MSTVLLIRIFAVLQASSASPKSRPAETMTTSKPVAVAGRPAPMLPFKRPSVSETKVNIADYLIDWLEAVTVII